MDRWKAEMGRVREEKRIRQNIKKRNSLKREDPGAWKGRKVAKQCVFPMICGSGGSKSRLNVQNTPGLEHFWKLRCRKSARRCGTKHISKSKCTKHTMLGPLLEVAMSKKCTPLWREAQFEVKMLKAPHVRATFGRSDLVLRGRRKGLCTLSKVSFLACPKNDGRRGTFEEDLETCIFRGRRSTRDMFIRAFRRSGRWFPEKGCILEPPIFRFAEMILRDRCSTSYDLASLFRGRRSSLDRWTKHSKTHWYEAVSSALNFPFLKEVLQNSFVFDVVNFEKWGSLAELFRVWCCQAQKLRESRRIAAFLMLSSSKTEEVSQNSFVFKLADRQIDKETTTTTSTTTLHYYYKYKYITLLYTTLITLRYTNYTTTTTTATTTTATTTTTAAATTTTTTATTTAATTTTTTTTTTTATITITATLHYTTKH